MQPGWQGRESDACSLGGRAGRVMHAAWVAGRAAFHLPLLLRIGGERGRACHSAAQQRGHKHLQAAVRLCDALHRILHLRAASTQQLRAAAWR